MSVKITSAQSRHFKWLATHDQHVAEAWVRRCISLGEYFVAELEAMPVGFLRFSWFWGTIPYMELIYVLPDHRHSGIGRALFERWEIAMRRDGARLLMTSSARDEAAPQGWHSNNGFREAGTVTFGCLQQTPEAFFTKDLR